MLSGTVGAAKTAARDHGIPALASSQGRGPEPADGRSIDYDSGVAAVMTWLAEHRSALAAGTVTTATVDNLNIPSCAGCQYPWACSTPRCPTAPLAPSVRRIASRRSQDPKDDVEPSISGFINLGPVPAN